MWVQHIKHFPLIWCVVFISLIPSIGIQVMGIQSIAGWFMPNSLVELVSTYEIWRIVTPIFVHYTVVHLLVNLYLWWLLGCMVEKYSWRLLLGLLLLSGIITNIGQFYFSGPKFGGLSGVVYALFGFVWLTDRLVPNRGFAMDQALAAALIIVMIIAATGLIGLFSNVAHFSGLLFGVCSAYICHSVGIVK